MLRFILLRLLPRLLWSLIVRLRLLFACRLLLVSGLYLLLIGLLVRKPFIGINNFVSEKIEETELL